MISIDYDLTFNLDPSLWTQVIELAQAKGWEVICITSRSEPPHSNEAQLPDGVEVFCTDGEPKREFAILNGLSVDIWIDDSPESI